MNLVWASETLKRRCWERHWEVAGARARAPGDYACVCMSLRFPIRGGPRWFRQIGQAGGEGGGEGRKKEARGLSGAFTPRIHRSELRVSAGDEETGSRESVAIAMQTGSGNPVKDPPAAACDLAHGRAPTTATSPVSVAAARCCRPCCLPAASLSRGTRDQCPDYLSFFSRRAKKRASCDETKYL